MSPLAGIFLMVAGFVLCGGIYYVIHIFIPKKRGEKLDAFIHNLESTGFTISKPIITKDFTPKMDRHGDPHIGIFIDYNQQKLAIRTSLDDLTPQIYDFKALKNYEVLKENKQFSTSSTSGGAVGVGMFAVGSAKTSTVSSDGAGTIEIRFTLSTETAGISSLTITLYKLAENAQVKASTPMYQGILECSRVMSDELNNIINTYNKSNSDSADELGKYKKLLDEGVITHADFDAKKKQLLGL